MPSVHKWKSLDALIFLIAGCLLAAIPVANHLLLRTYALDLGFYTHALFEYRQFRLADSDMLLAFHEPHLASHFDLYLPLISPLSWIFGSWTLLLVQWLAVLMAGVAIRRYIQPTDPWVARFAQLGFYAFYGIHNALAFDYHSNVVAACLLPWMFVALKNEKRMQAAFWLVLIWLGKENMSLWMVFVGLGWALDRRSQRAQRNWGLWAAFVSLVYFIAVMGWWMPALSSSGGYRGFLYHFALGDTPLEALSYVLAHPFDAAKLFLYHKLGDAAPAAYKVELFQFLLLSGLAVLALRPAWLLMVFPILAQKLWHDSPFMWGIGSQYSVEFAPLLILGAFELFAGLRIRPWAFVLALVQLSGILAVNAMNATQTVVYNEKTRLRIFQREHYRQDALDVDEVRRYISKQIPQDASVSAASPLVPHLAFREDIYEFPLLKDTQHMILLPGISVYPVDPNCFDALMEEIRATGQWKLMHEGPGWSHYMKQ